MTRRRLLGLAGAGTLAALGLGVQGGPAVAATARAPFKRLAVADPPFVEEYEVVIALAPPVARNTVAKLITRAATTADERYKSQRVTEALDPEKTQLHEHFVQALADRLADAEVKTVAVPVDAADSEDALFGQMRAKVPQADGLLLANVMGRFVALHGLESYVPALMVGIKAMPARAGAAPWLDQIFSVGFRGIDPRADHLEAIELSERFDDIDALLGQIDRARAALVRATEEAADAIARRLMAA